MVSKKEDLDKNIQEYLLSVEKRLMLAQEDLKVYKLINESSKSEILNILNMHKLEHGNYFKIVEKNMLKEIPIKTLKDTFTENIFDNICVSVDIEATRNHLKVNCDLSDIIVDSIIEKIDNLQLVKVKDLVEIVVKKS